MVTKIEKVNKQNESKCRSLNKNKKKRKEMTQNVKPNAVYGKSFQYPGAAPSLKSNRSRLLDLDLLDGILMHSGEVILI